MAALAAEDITMYTGARATAALPRDDEYGSRNEPDVVAGPSFVSVPNLSYTYDARPESLEFQEAPEAPVSRRIMILRQLSCYLSFYVSGYK